MRLDRFLKTSQESLKTAGISSARLDVLILLEDTLHKDRSWLLAHPELELNQLQTKRLEHKLARRARHVPLSYIRGHSEFYGRRFKLNRHVLEPRPESETMISLLRKLVDSSQKTGDRDKTRSTVYGLRSTLSIADVGTGSGALGITAALEIADSQVDLYDISASALAVAKHNTHLHELHLHCRKMNLLARPLRSYDVILANLPYVPNDWKINQAATAEPKIAIFGGPDGLDVYRQLFTQLHRFAWPRGIQTSMKSGLQSSIPRGWQPKYVLTESMPPQHEKLATIAGQAGFKLYKTDDFIQIFTPVKNT
jgi:release factor glutamine methyltransferase